MRTCPKLVLFIGILSFALISNGCFRQRDHTVRLAGVINGYPSNHITLMDDAGDSRFVPNKNQDIHLNDSGRFELKFKLDKPSYFRLGMNTLYVSPGDDLEVIIEPRKPQESVFRGKGWQANMYLRNIPSGWRGAYLNGGQNIKEDFSSTFDIILKAAREREDELDTLSGISKEFIMLEKARIKSQVLISILEFPSYFMRIRRENDPDRSKEQNLKMETYSNAFGIIEKYSALLNFNPEHLKISDYSRLVFLLNDTSLISQGLLPAFEPDQRIIDFYITSRRYIQLSRNFSAENIERVETASQEISYLPYRNYLTIEIEDIRKFSPGQPAMSFEMHDPDGNRIELSDLKGSVLYIDVWATWCVPCLNEIPNFEALKKEYFGENVKFISISVDSKKEDWANFIADKNKKENQYISSNENLRSYRVTGIPRFILLNKDFVIVDADAPRPGTIKIRELLDDCIDR